VFNIYINKVVQEGKEDVSATKGIQLKNESTIKTILYTNDQVLITKSEDELHIAAY
jgi:hypothetical protein